MTLLALKKHMLQVKMASLGSLCSLFKADPDTVRCLLAHWIRKGMIKKCFKKPGCVSKCSKCPLLDVEIYEWTDSPAILN